MSRRLHQTRKRARTALGLAVVVGAAAVAVTAGSAAIARHTAYPCSNPGTPGPPTVAFNSYTSTARTATMTTTVNPNGAPAVLSAHTTGTLITALTGANNDLVWTSTFTGHGQGTKVVYREDVAGAGLAITDLLDGTVEVDLGMSPGHDILTTANDIIAANAGNPAATVTLAPGNDGTGIVTAMANTPLAVFTAPSVGVPSGGSQSAQVTLSGLTPNIPYTVVFEITNECDAALPNHVTTTGNIQTQVEIGLDLIGFWSAPPAVETAAISGSVVVAPDPASGASGSTVTCAGSYPWLTQPLALKDLDMQLCAVSYDVTTPLTLTETPGPNTYFVGWGGLDCAPWGFGATCYADVIGVLDDTATFSEVPALGVTFLGTGNGTVTSSPAGLSCTALSVSLTCTSFFTANSTVTLTEVPVAGDIFLGWGGDATTCGLATTCAVTMTGSKSVTATFGGRPTLFVSRAGSGSGTVTTVGNAINCSPTSTLCSAKYDADSKVVLTATPAPGSTFAGWGSTIASCSGTSSTCTVFPRFSDTVTALFSAGHTLTITPSGSGAGTVTSSPSGISCPPTCAAVFPEGMQVTLSTLAAAGSTFDGWDDGPCFDRGVTAPCSVTIVDDLTMPVLFANPATGLSATSSYKGCTIVGTSRNDVLVGRGHDVVCGGGGNDRLIGTGNDILLGGAGNDTLVCSGSCRMYGGDGKDKLVARGAGLSELFGGAGDDLFLVRNNVRNVVDGGAGKNRASFDRKLDVLRRIQVRLTK
jgi:Ca2+-binding RTX toxin-like protein